MSYVKLDPINIYPLPNGYAPGRLLPIAVEIAWGSPIYFGRKIQNHFGISLKEISTRIQNSSHKISPATENSPKKIQPRFSKIAQEIQPRFSKIAQEIQPKNQPISGQKTYLKFDFGLIA